VSEWQTMDTAPKDEIIVLLVNGSARVCFWDESLGAWKITRAHQVTARNPSHWLRIPEPPQ
jgi:hypothetical protein